MLTLPAELRPWEPYLGFFHPTLVPALGRLADQVLRELRRLGTRAAHLGEPAGWAGLDRRGPFERLLLSDWALAELAPDEFLRRATEGELLFWQRERAASPLGGTSRLLLDCGPYQLGACRVGQLALLLALARRAAESGRRFSWQVGQVGTPFEGLSEAGVAAFLRSRSCQAVPDQAVEAFFAGAGPEDELWLAGSRQFLERHEGGLQVCLTQVGPEAIRLEAPGKSVVLELPPPECSRLLRDPFRARQAGLAREAASGDLQLSGCGRKLLVRSPGRVVVYPIPNSPRDELGSPRSYAVDPAFVVLAVGAQFRDVLLMEAGRGAWRFRRVSRQRTLETCDFPRETGPLGGLGRVWLEAPDRAALAAELEDSHGAAFRQREGRLRLFGGTDPRLLEIMCRHAPRVWMVLDGELWMSHPAHGLTRMAEVAASLGNLAIVGSRLYRAAGGALAPLGRVLEGSHYYLGYSGSPDDPAVAAFDGECWWIRHGTLGARLRADNVRGVIHDPHHWRRPALVATEGSTVLFVGEAGERAVEFPGTLEALAFTPGAPRIAYRAADGELGVYSLPHQRFLLRVRP